MSPLHLETPAVLFGLASLSVLTLTLLTSRRWGDLAFPLLLCAMWAATKAEAWAWGWPTARVLYLPDDLVALGVCCALYLHSPAQWKLGVAFAYFTKLCIHAWFWRHGATTPPTHAALYNYGLSLNILDGMKLVLASAPWGGSVIGLIGTWVFGGRRAPPLPHSASRRPSGRR